MKKTLLKLWLPVMVTLSGCVAIDPPRPSYREEYRVDMLAPVYLNDHPEHAYYYRYDPGCDCIRLVRMVQIGGQAFWLDTKDRRVREGRWDPSSPSNRALREHRDWERQHQHEVSRTPPAPRPEYRVDMMAPVYVKAYPEHVFYYRFDRGCNCIRIVRMVQAGKNAFWLDHTGKRVHEGDWAPTNPSAHALRVYRDWERNHQYEVSRTRPAQPLVAPPVPQVPPVPQATNPAEQPKAGHGHKHPRRGENGEGVQKNFGPKGQAEQGDGSKPAAKFDEKGQITPATKPEATVKPVPVAKPNPVAKPGEPSKADPKVRPQAEPIAESDKDKDKPVGERHRDRKCPDNAKDC